MPPSQTHTNILRSPNIKTKLKIRLKFLRGNNTGLSFVVLNRLFFELKFIGNWQSAQEIKKNTKSKRFLHLYWDLNPVPPAYEASVLTIILTHIDSVKCCAQQSIPVFCQVAACTKIYLCGKKSNVFFKS